MKDKINKFIPHIVIAVLLLIFVSYGVYCVIQKAQEEKEIRQIRLEQYSASLHITGDFVIAGDIVTINNKEYDEKGLIQDISLYNAFYKDTPITIDMLMEEYEVFCNGMNESELIENYRERMKSISVRAENVELHVNGYDYERYIIEYLNDTYDTSLSRATVEEMRTACPYGAEKIYNEVLSLENMEK